MTPGRGIRAGWLVPLLIAAGLLWLLVNLTSSPKPRPPSAPEVADRAATNDRPPLPDRVDDEPMFSRRIEGRVLRTGEGVAARVTLLEFTRFPGRPLREDRADAAGFFAFGGVPPGRHELGAIGPAGLRIRRTVIVPAGLDPAPVVLRFPAWEHTFRGRAVHADGRPFSGMAVFNLGGLENSVEAPTRADGRFEIPGFPPGRFTPEFHSGRGFRARGRSVVHPAPGEVTFVVDHGAQVIRGTVLDARTGAAVPGAELKAVGRNDACPSVTLRVRSGPDGGLQFAVPTTLGVLEDLEVTAEGYRPWCLFRFPVTGDLEIALSPSPRLTVRVVEADCGAPAPFVPVKASFRSLPDVNEHMTLLTDRTGRVTFSSISGDTVLLSVRGHGYATDDRIVPEEGRLYVLTPGEEREVELRVTRSVTFVGKVSSADGHPVTGCWVSQRTPGSRGSRNLEDGYEFLIEDLLPGAFTLRASRHKLRGEEVSGTTTPGEVRRVDLALGEGAWLTLTVLGEDTGRPVSDAWVQLQGGGRLRTDAEGKVGFGPFGAGWGGVDVEHKDYRPLSLRIDFAVGDSVSATVALDPGMSLSGRVLLADGTPAADAEVKVSGKGIRSYLRNTRTGEDGTFLVRGLPDGMVSVYAVRRAEGGAVQQCYQDLETGTTAAILALEPWMPVECRKVRLLVTDVDGSPIPRADFEVLFRYGPEDDCDLDSGRIVNGRGEIEIDPDAIGFELYVFGARQPGSIPLPLGDARFGSYPATVECVEVTLPPSRAVTGKVVGPDGRGVPGIELRGYRKGLGDELTAYRFPWFARSAPDGSFTMEGFGAGTVAIHVEKSDPFVLPHPVVMVTDEKAAVIRVDSLTSAIVSVTGPDGRPVQGAYVAVFDQARIVAGGTWQFSEASGITDDAGRVRIAELPAHTRHILIVESWSWPGLAPVRIDGWLPQDTEVALAPALSIAGRVIDPNGQPHSGVEGRVFGWCRAGGWELVGVHEGGKFEESGFAKGPVALVYIPPGVKEDEDLDLEPERYPFPITWVSAGDRDIVFRIPAR